MQIFEVQTFVDFLTAFRRLKIGYTRCPVALNTVAKFYMYNPLALLSFSAGNDKNIIVQCNLLWITEMKYPVSRILCRIFPFSMPKYFVYVRKIKGLFLVLIS